MLYNGPPGAAAAWFAARGLPCPPDTAVAEHLLGCASAPSTLRQLLAAGADAGKGVDGAGNGAVQLPVSSPAIANGGGAAAKEAAAVPAVDPPPSSSGAGLWRELGVLFWRALLDMYRNPSLLLLHW